MSIMKSKYSSCLRSIKSVTVLLIVMVLCGCIFEMPAQNRRSGKKKEVKKEKNMTIPSPESDPKPEEESFYISPCFEGDLLYRNEEFHSKFIRATSGGMAYNGDRSVLLTLCEEGMRISDLDKHFHTVIIPEEQIGYVYSDMLDYGYVLTMDQIKQLYSALDLEYNFITDDPDFIKSGGLVVGQEKKEYTGDDCSIIKGKVTVGDSNENETEMWVYDCAVCDAYKYFTYGYNPNGIVKKMILNVRVDLPLFGNVKSMVACELVGVEERPVDVEELLPPESIGLRHAKDISKLYGYYKAVNKELKKCKLQPETKKAKEVKRSILAKWDFADDWLNVKLHSQSSDEVEKSLSESLKNVLDSFASIGKTTSNEVSTTDAKVEELDDNKRTKSNEEDLVYIPDLIREVESGISTMKSNVDNYDAACAYNASHSRKKRVRIGGSYVFVSEVEGMRKPILNKTEYGSAKSEIADTRRIIDLLIQYGRNNNTDSISRERYNKISKAVKEASSKNRKMAHKSSRDRKLSNCKKYYNHYASMLSSIYYFEKDRDFKWIRDIQNKMKKLRQECGCNKSPWEDWNGITDPT